MALLKDRETMAISEFLEAYWHWPIAEFRGRIVSARDELAKLEELHEELESVKKVSDHLNSSLRH